MPKNYLLPVVLSALLLAGCSRQANQATEAAGPAAPTKPDPASQPLGPVASPAPGSAQLPASRRAATLAAKPAARGAEAVWLRPHHNSTTLAAAPQDTLAEVLPDSARATELRRYLRTGLPPAQVFTIRPGRDTLLLAAQGTQLLLPATAWDLPPGTAEVRLELQEFYTPADMVLAGLSTTTGPELLETGGMLKLTATAQGQPARLRPGSGVYLRMPAKKAQPGMQLYEGVAQGPAHHLDWQLPPGTHLAAANTAAAGPVGVVDKKSRYRLRRRKPQESNAVRDSLAVDRPTSHWPEYAGFDKQLRAQWLRYAPSAGRLRRSRTITSQAREALNHLSKVYDQRIVRQLQVQFIVDSTGAISTVEALPNGDAELTPAAVSALRQLGPWKPATLPFFVKTELHREPVAAQGTLHIVLNKAGQLYSSVSWQLPRASRPRALQLRHQLDLLLASPDFRRRYHRVADSLAAVRGARQDRLPAQWGRLRTQFSDTSRAAITERGVYNELYAQGFQWINCDRLLVLGPLIDYQVQDRYVDAVVTLMFRRFNSVVQGSPDREALVRFSNVPDGQPATIVALRREKGITYLATEPVVLTQAPLTRLHYRPVTMAELRAAINNL